MRKILLSIGVIILIIVISLIIYILPPKKYSNNKFNIKTYISNIDMDNDGIDDQTDIINNTFEYISKKPKYKSKYYSTGYPDDEYGTCVDVVGYALLHAGYDLQELVNEDIINNRSLYNIDVIDKNIDFRRVPNLLVYFKNNSIELTTDLTKIDEWQGGDIVVFPGHIGIISSNRNRKGISLLIHHGYPMQVNYEEDVLDNYKILGHFRIS